jgi:hypothetical protein
MNPIEHMRRVAAVLAGLAAALTALGATPAFAKVQPEPGGAGAAPASLAPPADQVHTAVAGGMPAWQVALIAVAAALLAAAVAVLADRARASRRRATTAVA